MNWKIIGVTALSALVLFGCGGDDKEARMGTKGNNYENSAHNNDYSPQGDEYNNVDYDNGPNQGMMDGQNYNNVNEEENVGNEDTYRNTTNDNNGNRQYNVAREAAQKVSKQVAEVDRAYVMKTRNNAFVAVTMNDDDNDKVDDQLKSEIAKVVKSTDRDIDNVYVSANENFVQMNRDYADDVRNGEPIEGFFREFGQMINRLFPEVR
ncbi:YhcN/YlaJ family sporulation lipoprotein [Pontibacillus salicampi]|uniref:YhcN/YlaJ family sporulation lipoprotein n=1 Tax=Pontibacillus salicampi TaxID=1449801 RepID=A0ABV6LLU4_9BACI